MKYSRVDVSGFITAPHDYEVAQFNRASDRALSIRETAFSAPGANVNTFDSKPFRRSSGAEMIVPMARGSPDADDGRLEALVLALVMASVVRAQRSRAAGHLHETMMMVLNYFGTELTANCGMRRFECASKRRINYRVSGGGGAVSTLNRVAIISRAASKTNPSGFRWQNVTMCDHCSSSVMLFRSENCPL
jgi:hypothetical protein